MRAGGGAAVGVVTVGVNVHATLGAGIMAGNVPADGRLGTLRGLLESDGTGDLGVSTEDGNCTCNMSATHVSRVIVSWLLVDGGKWHRRGPDKLLLAAGYMSIDPDGDHSTSSCSHWMLGRTLMATRSENCLIPPLPEPRHVGKVWRNTTTFTGLHINVPALTILADFKLVLMDFCYGVL